MYNGKDSHLTRNVLLHYLVKVEDVKMLAPQESSGEIFFRKSAHICRNSYYKTVSNLADFWLRGQYAGRRRT